MEEGDNNEAPSENKNQIKFLKAIMSVNKSSSSEESEPGTDIGAEEDFKGELKIVIISDDEDAEVEHISDISNPSYDPRRYVSYKFRHSPTRMDSTPILEETNKAARYPKEEQTEKYTCVDESTTHNLTFATRYPNYFGDFKFIKYPPLEDVSPPEFQVNRPHYITDIETDYNNFTPWRERAEREEKSDSSSIEDELIYLDDIDYSTELDTRSCYQEPSTLLSIGNVPLKQKVANPSDKHEFVNLNKMQREVTFESEHQISEPLPYYSTDKEAWEYIRVTDTELSSQENQYSDIQKLVNPPPVQKQKSTKVRSDSAPLIYEDFKEHVYGPKPQYWIDFQEAGEIGKTVAIFDSRDFGYNNKNIKPMWTDKDFDFHAPIRDDFHQFSKIFMSNIPFYDNESEEIQRFARQYKLLRAGPKYNIQEPSQEKKSDINLQKEPKQTDSIKDTSASKTQISEFEGTIKTKIRTDKDSTIKPLASNQLKSVLKPPKREKLTATDKECFEKRIYCRSDIAGSINPTAIKRVTFKLDEKNEKRPNNSDVSQNAQFRTGVFTPTKILKRGEMPEEYADKFKVNKNTQSYTDVSIPTKRNEETMTEKNANNSDVSQNAQFHTGVFMPTKILKRKEIPEENADKLGVSKNTQHHTGVLTLTGKTIQSCTDITVNTSSGKTGIKSKVDDVAGKQGKTSESDNTNANNRADQENQSSKSKKGNQQKHQISKN